MDEMNEEKEAAVEALREKESEAVDPDGEIRSRAVDALLERGVVFEAERRGWLRFLRPKMRLVVNPPTLGVLYAISGELAAMKFDEKKMEGNPLGYSFALVRSEGLALARAVAFAVLGSRWKVKLLGGVYARYLLWQLTARQVFRLVLTVLSVSGAADFINSIRLVKGAGLVEPRAERPIE